MFRISADIKYLDGNLSGLVIPSGYTVTMPDNQSAMRVALWIYKVRKENDFVRAVGTASRYQFTSSARIDRA